jgi:hypothetical protein
MRCSLAATAMVLSPPPTSPHQAAIFGRSFRAHAGEKFFQYHRCAALGTHPRARRVALLHTLPIMASAAAMAGALPGAALLRRPPTTRGSSAPRQPSSVVSVRSKVHRHRRLHVRTNAAAKTAQPTTPDAWEATSPVDFTASLEAALGCDKVVIIGRVQQHPSTQLFVRSNFCSSPVAPAERQVMRMMRWFLFRPVRVT